MSDKRLIALYDYEASKEIRKEGDAIREALSGKGGIGLSVGFGSSKRKMESHATVTQAAKSHVTAGGDVNVTAKKDITLHGSDVSGKDVNLKAGTNIHISSSDQTHTNTTNQTSKGGGLGVTFGGGLPVTVNGTIYRGNEKEQGTEITHRGSTVTADQTLTVESGKDTNILGSKAKGNKVVANIGGNLNIQSEKERNDYDSHSSSMGGGFGTDIARGHTSGSAGVNQGKINSNYQSVTNQAGIYAGKEGFNITVKGNTDLKGAVIDSSAPAEKNHLTTGTLTWEDTGNKEDYKAGGAGVSYAGKDAKLNARGLTPNIAPTVKGEADSITKSAVAKGTVTITNTKDQKQNISDLTRDTKNSLNKLKDIFDKNKVQEKQEFIGLLSKDLNEAIHKVADQNHWDDGSKEKTALHAIVSGMLSEMSGSGFNSGALAGGVNEYVIGYLIRTKHEQWMLDHPDLVEWLSTAIGGAIGKAAGGDVSVGAGVALEGTKWNYFGFEFGTSELIKADLKRIDGRQLSKDDVLELELRLMRIVADADPYSHNSENLEEDSLEVINVVRKDLRNEGFTESSIDKFLLDYRRRTDQQIESMKKENIFYHRMILVNGYRSKDLWADAVSNRVMRKILSGEDYIEKGYSIFKSEYPGDKIYSIAMGTFAGISVKAGMTLSFIKAGWNPTGLASIILINTPSVVFGGYMTDSLDESFKKYHNQ